MAGQKAKRKKMKSPPKRASARELSLGAATSKLADWVEDEVELINRTVIPVNWIKIMEIEGPKIREIIMGVVS